MNDVAVVIIGRNEGPRLGSCLDSVCGRPMPIIYADSGSTDGSVELARSKGAAVVGLDASLPFTAARGRNAGFAGLMEIDPAIEFVQFVDGDCQISPGWTDQAAQALRADATLAAVRGHLSEKSRQTSIYARLCDMEWRRPPGPIQSCGGIAMIRASAFRQVGGFNSAIAAGEEAEFCRRLYAAGYGIRCIDADMGTHDAGIRCFAQWWKRMVRSGQAYAHGVAIEPKQPERRNLRAVVAILAWSVFLPLLMAALAWPTRGLSLALLAGYALLWLGIRRGRRRGGDSPDDASLYATFCLIGKFAQVYGIGRYLVGRIRP